MEKFTALVACRRGAAAEYGEGEENDECLLRIQLEEIVIVKNDAYDAALAASASAARADGSVVGATTASSSTDHKCGNAIAAAAAAPGRAWRRWVGDGDGRGTGRVDDRGKDRRPRLDRLRAFFFSASVGETTN
ncbi:hypothetical protein GUJ93_ZPchr0002g24655 [Zizania palustris]|uniref:Uncharacterized protein n=1 Tax=Zizania palustris TaxID=103762 RepID=A0A8J5RUB5_ZIZPA|nr:hypothetical protein GUJ93_ZPchr0002g24655 [Zizania palustris]